MPRVSIVTALFNHRPFLAERARSIFSQTLRDFEWIVIDDCSTDGSYDEICRLTVADARVKVLRNERNLGHMRTSQRGLDQARGTFVYRVDSDDSCDARFLETMSGILAANPTAGFASCRSLRMDVHNGVWGGFPRRPGCTFRAPDAFPGLALGYSLRAPSLLLRRETLEAVGGFDRRPAGMTTEWHADWHLSLRMSLVSDLITYPKPLAYHRTHGTNLSRDTQLMLNNFALLEDVFDNLPAFRRDLEVFRPAAYGNAANRIYWGLRDFPMREPQQEYDQAMALIARYVPGFQPTARSATRHIAERVAEALIKRLTYRRRPIS